jgi:hypothetical protein
MHLHRLADALTGQLRGRDLHVRTGSDELDSQMCDDPSASSVTVHTASFGHT